MSAARLTSVPEGVPCVLRIATVEQGTTSTIEFEGEWDLGQCGATRDAVAQALQRRPECLVLDLSRLSFIDSSGIHALMETHERCIEQKTRLVITPGPRAVQRVLEICGLIEILPFAPAASSVSSHTFATTTEEPGGSSLRPQRRRRPLTQATGGAAPRATRK
jgi:anti-anti-sigma factor